MLAALYAAAAPLRTCLAQRGAQAGKPRAAGKALVILDSTRDRDGLRGPVRRVRTEVARLNTGAAGRAAEGPRRLLEVTIYDAAGRRTENATYPVVNSPAGEETNAYDERGNLAETVVRDARGRILSRTVYAYDFDAHGNWTKMTASLSVVGPAGPALEPVEVTYRAITYYSPGDSAAAQPGAAADRGIGKASANRAATPTSPTTQAAAPAPAPRRDAPASGPAVSGPATQAPPAQAPAGTGAPEDFSSLPDVGLLNHRASSLPPPAFPVGSNKPARGLVLVVVEVVVDETGRVLSALSPEGPQALREAAEEAARRAVFAPFVNGGVPRRVRGTLRYTFPYAP